MLVLRDEDRNKVDHGLGRTAQRKRAIKGLDDRVRAVAMVMAKALTLEVSCLLQCHGNAPVRGSCAMLTAGSRRGVGQPETRRSFAMTSPGDHIMLASPTSTCSVLLVCKSNQ